MSPSGFQPINTESKHQCIDNHTWAFWGRGEGVDRGYGWALKQCKTANEYPDNLRVELMGTGLIIM